MVEDSEGPAVVVGCDDGAVYAWDLGGHDKGQIYAEMRSLSPMEVPEPYEERAPVFRMGNAAVGNAERFVLLI